MLSPGADSKPALPKVDMRSDYRPYLMMDVSSLYASVSIWAREQYSIIKP